MWRDINDLLEFDESKVAEELCASTTRSSARRQAQISEDSQQMRSRFEPKVLCFSSGSLELQSGCYMSGTKALQETTFDGRGWPNIWASTITEKILSLCISRQSP